MNKIIDFIRQKNHLKTIILLFTDLIISFFSVYLFYIFRFEKLIFKFDQIFISYFCSIFALFSVIIFFKPYSQFHRFFNYNSIKFYTRFFFYYLIIILSLVFIIRNYFFIPRSFPLVQTLFLYILFIFVRYQISLITNYQKEQNLIKKTLVFGSKKPISRLFNNLNSSYKIKSIVIKDDTEFVKKINGINVYSESDIKAILDRHKIDTFIVALDDNNIFNKRKYIKLLYDYNISIILFDEYNNFLNLSNQIDIGSLLFRDHLQSNININFKRKVILVSGGAGSIGTEITKQLILNKADTIIILDNSEYNLFQLHNFISDLKTKHLFNTRLVIKLCDISNIKDVDNLLSNFKIDYVYHCAAYKHVPIVEENILISLKNNSLNTHAFLKYCLSKKIKNFTLISSDKAVRPTNIMGATKRIAELFCLYLNKIENIDTNISIVRFGNVLESSGSVVPIFKSQILNGGPVTVSDPAITRYFMSLEEASLLVLESSIIGKGGEIYLLDMGEPIKILDLAKKMIRLSGKSIKSNSNPNGDIEIIFKGMKPGEKLYEELLIDNNSKKTINKLIFQSVENQIDIEAFNNLYTKIIKSYEKSDYKNIMKLLDNKMIGYIGK